MYFQSMPEIQFISVIFTKFEMFFFLFKTFTTRAMMIPAENDLSQIDKSKHRHTKIDFLQ